MHTQRLSATFIGLLAISTVFGSATASAQDRPPDFTARWLPSCEADESSAYFTVHASINGDVHYVGGAQAQESGEKTMQVKPYDVRKMLNRAEDFIRAPEAPARTTRRPEACMEFTARVDGKMRTRREPVGTKVGQVFAKDFARNIPVRPWACPGRAAEGAPAPAWGELCRGISTGT